MTSPELITTGTFGTLKWPVYVWEPASDITAYELSRSLPMFASGLVRHSELEKLYKLLPPECQRHWRIEESATDAPYVPTVPTVPTVPRDNVSPELVDVWEVHPHLNTDYDYAVFDDHTKAIAYVSEVASAFIDGAGDGDEIAIKVKHTSMTRYDYEESANEEC